MFLPSQDFRSDTDLSLTLRLQPPLSHNFRLDVPGCSPCSFALNKRDLDLTGLVTFMHSVRFAAYIFDLQVPSDSSIWSHCLTLSCHPNLRNSYQFVRYHSSTKSSWGSA